MVNYKNMENVYLQLLVAQNESVIGSMQPQKSVMCNCHHQKV
jgi:hypothetical protein